MDILLIKMKENRFSEGEGSTVGYDDDDDDDGGGGDSGGVL